MFAPTDAAFAKVPKATLVALGKDKALLKSVLLYHVAKGKVTAAKVVKLKSVKTLQGGMLPIRVSGGKVFVVKAQVVTPDVMASNGSSTSSIACSSHRRASRPPEARFRRRGLARRRSGWGVPPRYVSGRASSVATLRCPRGR